MPEEQASPELKQFFINLSELKEYIKNKADETGDEEIQTIYNKLHKIFKSEGEQ